MGYELRPCKRCGLIGKVMYQTYSDGTEDYWVVCTNRFCEEETGAYETQGAAAEEWNEPSEEQLLHAEVDKLHKKVEMMMEALQNIDQSACYPADVQPDLPPGDLWALIERIHDIAYKAIKGDE